MNLSYRLLVFLLRFTSNFDLSNCFKDPGTSAAPTGFDFAQGDRNDNAPTVILSAAKNLFVTFEDFIFYNFVRFGFK